MTDLKDALRKIEDALKECQRLLRNECDGECLMAREALALCKAIREAVPEGLDTKIGWPYPSDVKDDVMIKCYPSYYHAAYVLNTITGGDDG